MKLDIQITGMHCNQCTRAIEAALAAVPAVDEYEVCIGSATVCFRQGTMDKSALFAAIRGAGSFDIRGFSASEE